jgi:hypothetical protein
MQECRDGVERLEITWAHAAPPGVVVLRILALGVPMPLGGAVRLGYRYLLIENLFQSHILHSPRRHMSHSSFSPNRR